MIEVAALKRRANAIARTALSPLPLDFWRAAFPKDLVALCYHVVSDDDLPHLQLYPYKNVAQFEADVRFARDRAVTYRAVAEHRLNGAPLPRNSILFTFDDGLVQCYDVARPILRKHGVDAVFFVTTDYLDDRATFFESALSLCASAIASMPEETARSIHHRLQPKIDVAATTCTSVRLVKERNETSRLRVTNEYARGLIHYIYGLSEDDPGLSEACTLAGVDLDTYLQTTPIFLSRRHLRELASDGFTIGAHGRRHRSLVGNDIETIEQEIVMSCEAVRDVTGQARVPFAFPYSGLGIDRSALAGIVARNPLVELVFDSGCLRRDRSFIINRVFADAPDATSPDSNVPTALRDAWSVPSAWFRT